MTSLANTIKRTAAEMVFDEKPVDLQTATVDPQVGHPSTGMTTVHGMPLYNTETWYAPPSPPFSWADPYARYQAEGHAPSGRWSRSSRGPGCYGEDPPVRPRAYPRTHRLRSRCRSSWAFLCLRRQRIQVRFRSHPHRPAESHPRVRTVLNRPGSLR